MAKDNNYAKELKIKALEEAIELLIQNSNSKKNLVTFENIVNKANELLDSSLTTNISITSIKKPMSPEFQKIRDKYDDYQKEHEILKNSISKKSSSEIKKMQQQIENLMFEVTKYLDDKLLLEEQIELKDKTISKLKAERDELYKIVNHKS